MFVICATAVSFLLLLFYCYRKFWCHRYFKRLGIPGPSPHFLFGNMLDLWIDNSHLVLHEWTKQYGDVFGYYEGSRPVLVVSSIPTVESICIKQSSAFTGRMAAPVQPDSDKEPDHPLINMMIAKGERWRRPRVTACKFFSAPKMRTILPFFERRISSLLSIIQSSNGKPLEVCEPFERYAMDSLGEAAFGLNLRLFERDDATGEFRKNPVFEQAHKMMSECLASTPFAFKVVTVLPEIFPIVKFVLHFVMKFSAGPLSPFNCFFKMMDEAIVDERKADSQSTGCPIAGARKRSSDLLRLFIDVTKFKEDEKTNKSKEQAAENPLLPICPGIAAAQTQPERYMSEQELKVQLVMFFLSGYETTSISLSFLCAVLATHQHVQARLLSEILRFFPNEETPIDYDTLMTKMVYLDCVCNELLRLYPVAINAVNRLVGEDSDVCGVPVTKDVNKVLVNVWTIHQSAEQWGPDADRFCPERFLPENLPPGQSRSAFLSFGIGAHQCIGKLFSLLEMKYVIVNILRRYLICPANNDPVRNSPRFSPQKHLESIPVKVAIVMTPRDPIRLAFTPRQLPVLRRRSSSGAP